MRRPLRRPLRARFHCTLAASSGGCLSLSVSCSSHLPVPLLSPALSSLLGPRCKSKLTLHVWAAHPAGCFSHVEGNLYADSGLAKPTGQPWPDLQIQQDHVRTNDDLLANPPSTLAVGETVIWPGPAEPGLSARPPSLPASPLRRAPAAAATGRAAAESCVRRRAERQPGSTSSRTSSHRSLSARSASTRASLQVIGAIPCHRSAFDHNPR